MLVRSGKLRLALDAAPCKKYVDKLEWVDRRATKGMGVGLENIPTRKTMNLVCLASRREGNDRNHTFQHLTFSYVVRDKA